MTGLRALLFALLVGTGLTGCGEETNVADLPAPQEPGAGAIGYFCGMAVVEHQGPKGQVFLRDRAEPLWFSSVRDALAFTMLPGEPKTVVALYVSDMSASDDWTEPQPGAWVLARDAVFVAGSSAVGGMGAQEVVPFGDRATAERFREAHGGEIYRFGEVPEHLVLGADGDPAAMPPMASAANSAATEDRAHGHLAKH